MSHWLRQDYGFTKADWYNPYEKLNQMSLPSESLYEVQRRTIERDLQQNSRYAQIEQVNKFIQDLHVHYHKLGAEGDLFKNLVNKINQGYAAFDNNQKPKPQAPDFLQNYEKNLLDIINVIAQHSGQQVPQHLVDQIIGMKNRILGGTDVNGSSIEQNFYAFRERKAAFLEDVATWIYSLIGYSSITSGNFVDEAGKQFLADSLAFLEDSFIGDNKTQGNGVFKVSLNIRGLNDKGQSQQKKIAQDNLLAYLKDKFPKQAENLSFGKNNWIEVTVDPTITGFQDFITETQNELKNNITIKFNDTFKEQVEQGLRTQVKSGSQQDLLNQQKRNMISQSTLSSWDELLGIAMEFYQNFQHDEKVDGGTSESLNNYINWTFSRNISSTVLGGNEFYLSSHGFSTLDKQMEEGKFHFELAPKINSLKLLATIGEYSIIQKENK